MFKIFNIIYSRDFILDLLSVLPTDLLFFFSSKLAMVRLNRFLKIHRVFGFMKQTEIRTNFPHLFHISRLITVCFIIFHWNSCLYFLLSIYYDYQSNIKIFLQFICLDAKIDDWEFSYEKILDPLFPQCNARLYGSMCLFDEDGLNPRERYKYADELVDFWEKR